MKVYFVLLSVLVALISFIFIAVIVASVSVGGAAFVLIFGDVIVLIAIIILIVKLLKKLFFK